MGRRIRVVLMILLLLIFCAAGGVILLTYRNYEAEVRIYEDAAEEFTERPAKESSAADTPAYEDINQSPLEVDFDRLLEVNGDVVGWLYCEDTVINYPVVQTDDNSYYLRRNIYGERQNAGSIFIEAANRRGFADSNTIIYGHHMRNGSMFACLDEWASQDFYEEHPVMWLLTPEQDYLVVLFAGYTTAATSDSYTIFSDPCSELEEYLEQCVKKSDFKADFELAGHDGAEGLGVDEKYVMFSTCAYSFENARYVLHGKLVPVDKDR